MSIFSDNISILQKQSGIEEKQVARFSKIIDGLDKWQLFRVNPYHFAKEHGFCERDGVDLFLHSARLGYFDLNWNMICPSCGGVEHSHLSISDLEEDRFFCNVCRVFNQADLDDHVEVSFTARDLPNKGVLNPGENHQAYRNFYFSGNFITSDSLDTYQRWAFIDLFCLQPGEVKTLDLTTNVGEPIRVISQQLHMQTMLEPDADCNGRPEVLFLDSGLSPEQGKIQEGETSIILNNKRDETVIFMVVRTDLERIQKLLVDDPPSLGRFLSGKELLNNQTFRELFNIQNLAPDLKLNIRSLTLLFTDLKGSTALYDQEGDVVAYRLIRSHFNVLFKAVKDNTGAVIKTMGDAVMAAFSRPEDGVQAAVAMMKEINSIKAAPGIPQDFSFGLKIGLHEGHALTINNNGSLDYFGQMVNISARVQGLADAGEIWVSDDMMSFPETSKVLKKAGYQQEEKTVALKGVGEAARVYRFWKVM